jgi:hypothetical protein
MVFSYVNKYTKHFFLSLISFLSKHQNILNKFNEDFFFLFSMFYGFLKIKFLLLFLIC